MITYIKALRLEPRVERPLLENLRLAEKQFKEGDRKSGLAALIVFADQVRPISLHKDSPFLKQAKVLLGEANLIQSCEVQLQSSRLKNATTQLP